MPRPRSGAFQRLSELRISLRSNRFPSPSRTLPRSSSHPVLPQPKGVVITHRNLLANLQPIEGEIAKYRRYAKPFLPLRILNLLPLSHLFGQSLSLFLPPLIPASEQMAE